MQSTELVQAARMPGKREKMCKMRKNWPLREMLQNKQKRNRIKEHETSSAEEDDWSPNKIDCVNQKIHSTRQMRKGGPDFFTLTALVNIRPIKFIIDSGNTGNFNTKFTFTIQ